MGIVVNELVSISTEEDLKSFEGFVSEAINSLIRIEAEQDHLKEIKKTAKEKFGIKQKSFNAIVAGIRDSMKTDAKIAELTAVDEVIHALNQRKVNG